MPPSESARGRPVWPPIRALNRAYRPNASGWSPPLAVLFILAAAFGSAVLAHDEQQDRQISVEKALCTPAHYGHPVTYQPDTGACVAAGTTGSP
ncbi:MAG: hypothetical protein M3Z11_04200 [Candidatus Dormibacteraeota bacterium]|nr:hypothetical protein [Candidatus Dormibacteraeota bacterium]